MDIKNMISFLAVWPLIGFIACLLIKPNKEKQISFVASFVILLQFILTMVVIVYWLWNDTKAFDINGFSVFSSKEYKFVINFYFDKVTAVYLFIGSFVSFIIARFSAYYMHLEPGYKRFFNTILLFFFGYNFTVLSGNFETLFIGWEVLGITSFLLIAFYRDRYLPVRNALKVFSVYRIGDIGIILAMWASHHLWNKNITFAQLHDFHLVQAQLSNHAGIGIFISLCLLIAAAGKSAQFPFSYWLPRAMEGPTPSSAIFYGSLSVHFGVFLLLRTFPFWEHLISVRIAIGLLGFTTILVAYTITRVQSTIKTQIAYASITQIGIMFIELAFGLETLVLIHFLGNAFLRTYQLLISPSIVSYMIRDQFYHFKPHVKYRYSGILKRMDYTLYVLSMQEWNMDKLVNKIIFKPAKKIGRKLYFLNIRNVAYYIIPSYVIAVILYFDELEMPTILGAYLPELFAFIGLLLVLKSFSERRFPRLSWILVLMNHFWIALAVLFNEHTDFSHVALYLSGIIVSGVIGYYAINRIATKEKKHYGLNQYYGHIYEHRRLALVFFLSALGLMCFPITPSFLGEDLIISHIHEDQYLLAILYSLSYVLGGISLVRIYARVFLGPHVKTYHPTPIQST